MVFPVFRKKLTGKKKNWRKLLTLKTCESLVKNNLAGNTVLLIQ
jgi:hypothetical protein